MSQIEQELMRTLSAPSTTPSPSSAFAERVLSEAARRLRVRALTLRLSIAGFTFSLGAAAWSNRPASPVVVAESPADAPAFGSEQILSISNRQAGSTSWVELIGILWSDAGLALAVSLGAAFLVAGLLRLWVRRRRPRTTWWEFLAWAVLGLGAVAAGFVAAFDVFWLGSDWMEPTISQGSRVVVDPTDHDPNVGDVIVVARPAATGRALADVRRVIGVGGDNVRYTGGIIVVNGARLVGLPQSEVALDGEAEDWFVPDGSVLLASDHPSSDELVLRSVTDIEGVVRWRTP